MEIDQDTAEYLAWGGSNEENGYEYITSIRGDKLRWETCIDVIFKKNDKHYAFLYMEPNTEYQEGGDRFRPNSSGNIPCREVEPVKVVTVTYKTVKK